MKAHPSAPPPTPSPPALATWLLERYLHEAQREFILGDLAESFHGVATGAEGPAVARHRYWRETMALLVARFPAPPPRLSQPPLERSMHSILWDLQQGVRGMLRSRAHAALAILTLAVGIGSATALFSIVYPVLLQAPPYPEPDRLAYVWEKESTSEPSNLGFATIQDLARETRSFSSWAMMSSWQPTLQLDATAEPLTGQRVSAGYFATLGIRPMLGRDFTKEEDTQATRAVVMLSYRLWQRAWSGDSAIVGRTVMISGRPHLVAGVMPRTFENLSTPQAEIWGPLGYDLSLPWACRTCRHLRMVVRLRPGVTHAAALADVEQVMARVRATYPGQYASVGGVLEDLRDAAIGTLRPVMMALGGAVLFLLLIACANVANLVLGRAFERQGEFSLRRALGAPGVRLVRQVTAETMLLAVVGGVLGLGLAALVMRLLPEGLASALPRTNVARLDPGVIAFAAVSALLTTVLAGLVPAVVALRGNMAGTMREAGRQVMGRSRHRIRSTLVIVEVSLAIVLLTGTGLMFRTMDQLLQVTTGFNPGQVATMSLSVSGPRFAEDAATLAYQRAVLEAARSLPGVRGVAITSQLPLGGNFDSYGVHRVDRPSANPESDPSAQRFAVSPDYHAVMGIGLVAGRRFTPADREGAPRVVLINRALAAVAFAGEDPIGREVRVGGNDGVPRTIVGIVDDVRHLSLDGVPESQIYLPFDQWGGDGTVALVAQVGPNPASMLGALEARVRSVDRSVAIASQAAMRDVVNRATGTRRFALLVLGAFAAIALVLSAAGMYGVIAASVAERRREIGVRAALGATTGRIVGMVVGQAAMVSAAGLAIGTAGAIGTGVALRSMLYGVAPWDATTLMGVVVVLALVALIACAVPAWRAARVDPVSSLRGD